MSEGTTPDKVELTTIEGECTADTLVLRLSSLTHKKGQVAAFEAVVANKGKREKLQQHLKRHGASAADVRRGEEMERMSIPPSLIDELENQRRLLAAVDMVDIDVGFMYYHEGRGPEAINGGARARYVFQLFDEDGKPNGKPNTELLCALAQRMVDKKEAVISVGRTSYGRCVYTGGCGS